MNLMDNDEYELSSDTEIDMILVDLPMELIKEQIKYQINDPLATNVNFIETVADKFNVLRATYENNSDALQNINVLITDFFGFIIKEISDKYDITVSVNDGNVESYIQIGSALYNFLILRYKKNVTRYIFQYIMRNKKVLAEEFEKTYKKKDVTSIAVKKKIKSKDDILILANLPHIIKFILEIDTDPLEFLSYASKEDNYEATIIRNLINQGDMIGDFTDKYIGLVVDQYNDILDEIQTDVKMKIIKKI